MSYVTALCGHVHYVVCHCVVWQYVTALCGSMSCGTMSCGSMSLCHVAVCHIAVCHCLMWQYVIWQCALCVADWQYVTVTCVHVAVCHCVTCSCGSMLLCHVVMWQYVTVSCVHVALCPCAVWHCCTMTVGDLPGHHSYTYLSLSLTALNRIKRYKLNTMDTVVMLLYILHYTLLLLYCIN